MQFNDANLSYYRCKVTDYTDNGELVVWYDDPVTRDERRLNQLYPAPRKAKEEITEEQKQENLQRANRRARSKFRKLAMTLKVDRILTLTFKENITDVDQANKLFVRFIKKVHQHYPEWKYVAVTEFQKRGAVHYHLGVSGFQDVGFIRATWRSLVEGNIDVTNPKKYAKEATNTTAVVGYLTKYLSKGFEGTQEGKYRYRASNGIELKQLAFWLQAQNWHDAQKEASRIIFEEYGRIGQYFFSDDWTSLWFSSVPPPLRRSTANSINS